MGETDENKINNMSYIWFQDVLEALGKRISFESLSNLYGKTTLDKKSGSEISKIISQANPLTKVSTKNSAATLMSLPGAMAVIENTSHQKEMAERALGDMSWFEEYLK